MLNIKPRGVAANHSSLWKLSKAAESWRPRFEIAKNNEFPGGASFYLVLDLPPDLYGEYFPFAF